MGRPYTHREIALLWVFVWLLRVALLALVIEAQCFGHPISWFVALAVVAIMSAGFELAFVREVRRKMAERSSLRFEH
jgi:hypothetical protein